MYFAMCFDNSMLVGLLLYLIALAVIICTPVVLLYLALLRWARARRERLASEALPGPNAGSTLGS